MEKAEVVVKGVLPGAQALREALESYRENDYLLTGFDDGLLRLGSQFLGEDTDRTTLPFAELVSRLCGCAEVPTQSLPSKGQTRAAIALACKQLEPGSIFEASASFHGTHLEIESSLETLRHYGVTIEDALISESPRTRGLAEISENVNRSLQAIGREMLPAQIDRLIGAKAVHRIPYSRVVILAGTNPPPHYLRAANWLAHQGVKVTALVPYVPGSANSDEHFRRVAGFLGSEGLKPTQCDTWYSTLFSDRALPSEPPEVEIFSAGDRLGECEWALRAAQTRMNRGLLAHRIGIFVRDIEGYGPLLRSASDRLGVPLSLVTRAPLLTNGFASLMLDLLRSLAGQAVSGLIGVARSTYWTVDPDERRLLVEKLLDLGPSGPNSWIELREWCKDQGDGLSWLSAALDWRQKAISEAAPLSHWHALIRELAEGTGLAQSIASPESPTRERDQRASVAMLRSVADRASVTGGSEPTALELSAFVTECELIWTDEETVLPSPRAGVQVISNPYAVPEVDALFILGMLEGTMPKRRREHPILRDDDIDALNESLSLEVPIPDSFTLARRERDIFLTLCGSATKSLVLSYPRTEEESDNIPAFYLEELRVKLGKSLAERTYPASTLTPVGPECLAASDVALFEALERPPERLRAPFLSTNAVKELVRPELSQGVPVAELARSLVCAFQAGFRFRLKLFREAHRDPLSQLARVPERARLAEASSPEAAEKALRAEIESLIVNGRREHEEWQSALIESAGQRLIDEWVRREFESREIWPRDQGSESFDLTLGDGLKNEIAVGDSKVVFKEHVAALGTINDYSVIKMYGSGVPKKELFEGEEPSSDVLRFGLPMLAQYRRATGVGIEVDGISGERRLLLAGKGNYSSLRSNAGENLERVSVSDDLEPIFKRIKASLRAAVEILNQADLKPTPGEHCSRCIYGDICRVSWETSQMVTDGESEDG